MSRRSSAEIINATLLEVFLAFIFVVLSIAWFERGRADTAFAIAGQADSLEDEVSSLTHERDTLQTALRRAQFNSPFPPICRPNALPRDFLTVTLASPGRVEVRVNRDELNHRASQTYSMSLEAFAATFNDVWTFSQDSLCRFRARVDDTEGLPKADFKSALTVVRRIFYTHGEFQ